MQLKIAKIYFQLSSLIYYNMHKVIVGFSFSSLTITVEFIIKAMGCNIIIKPLRVWETLHSNGLYNFCRTTNKLIFSYTCTLTYTHDNLVPLKFCRQWCTMKKI